MPILYEAQLEAARTVIVYRSSPTPTPPTPAISSGLMIGGALVLTAIIGGILLTRRRKK